jgi:hypothetical protein
MGVVFKSGAAIVNSGTFHTPAHPRVECELPTASAMVYTDLTENLEAPHPERRPTDLTGYPQTHLASIATPAGRTLTRRARGGQPARRVHLRAGCRCAPCCSSAPARLRATTEERTENLSGNLSLTFGC